MSIEVKGLDELIKAFLQYPEKSRRSLVLTLGEIGRSVTAKARSVHRFKRKTGSLDRSIRFETYGRSSEQLGIRIYLDSQITTTDSGFNYGWAQHDGTGKGYLKSWGSPPSEHKEDISGIPHDHFLTDSFDTLAEDNRKKLVGGLNKVSEQLF